MCEQTNRARVSCGLKRGAGNACSGRRAAKRQNREMRAKRKPTQLSTSKAGNSIFVENLRVHFAAAVRINSEALVADTQYTRSLRFSSLARVCQIIAIPVRISVLGKNFLVCHFVRARIDRLYHLFRITLPLVILILIH